MKLRLAAPLLLLVACGSSGGAEAPDGSPPAPDAVADATSLETSAPGDAGDAVDAAHEGAASTDSGSHEADGPCVPVNARYGLNINPTSTADPSAPDLGGAGASWVRVEFQDVCDATHPPAAFTKYDPILAALRATGLHVLLLVDYASTQGVPFGAMDDASWDAYAPSLAACAAAIAVHYPNVEAFEIWNEEDNPPGNPAYDPYVPPAAYGRMFAKTATAMRTALGAMDPGRSLPTILTGGLDSGSSSGYLPAVLAAVPGGIGADAIGIHSYALCPDPTWPPSWPDPGRGWGYLGDDLTAYAKIVPGMPLWITEFGTEDNRIQADYITRFYARLATGYASLVPYAIYFAWNDSGAGTFGLVDASGMQKPSYCTYRQSALRLQQCADAPHGLCE